jgi:hypothetical protein
MAVAPVGWLNRLRRIFSQTHCTVTMQTAEMENADLKEARRWVRKLRGFYILLATAAGVIALTATVKLLTTPDRLWFLWVVFGFAVAIAFSALNLFGRNLWLGSEWERRQIDRRLRQLQERR